MVVEEILEIERKDVCIEPYVMNVEIVVRYLLNQVVRNQYSAVAVLRIMGVEIEEDLEEDLEEEMKGLLKKIITKEGGIDVAIDDRAIDFDSQVMENVDICGIVVGKTTDCPT